jgi:hypothetical protein
MGQYQTSMDGKWLAFVGDASWKSNLSVLVGTLEWIDLNPSRSVRASILDGASELGAHGRSIFVSAPGANPPGIYLFQK